MTASGRRRPNGQPRLADVAVLAGVSIATASQALNGGAVAAATRTRVQEAAATLHYVPRMSAQALRTGRTRDIALRVLATPESVGYSEASFYYALIRGALAGADEADVHLSVQFVTTTPLDAGTRLATEAVARGFGALVVLPQWTHDRSYLSALANHRIPVVTLNDRDAEADCALGIDEQHGMRLAVDHLLQHGHRELGYVAGPERHLDAEARLTAFYRLCAEHGIRVRPEHVLRSDYAISAGHDVFARYLRSRRGGNAPTAWLAADDYIAAGVIQAAHAQGLRVPDDFSLVGYDDTEVAQATNPPLTSVHLPLFEMGHRAALEAARLIDGPAAGWQGPITLAPTLTCRASVREPATR